jgi:DNA repair protein RadA/Sms
VIGKPSKGGTPGIKVAKPERIRDIKYEEVSRVPTGVREFDLVIGGGIVSGMLALIGGEPGIGKSTLMLQLSQWMAAQGKKVLYVTGEESQEQIHLRSTRLGVTHENIWLLCTNDAEAMIAAVEEDPPDILIVDSIQSVSLPSLDSLPGSITQLRETCNRILRCGKTLRVPVFMVGHVTKEGFVAGPKIIEHMVDTVLYFEGEIRGQYKILRAVKNRFGSTNEIGIFEMTNTGLVEVPDPNHIFLSENGTHNGTAIGCIMEGSRSFIVEVQSLATSSNYGTPQRVVAGLEQKKLAILLAILEKNLALYLRSSDVFVNLAGGIRSSDPGLDLSILAAIISSLKDRPLPAKSVFIGEVGLNGEIRPVSQMDARINEAAKLGYEKIYISTHCKARQRAKVAKLGTVRELYGALDQG